MNIEMNNKAVFIIKTANDINNTLLYIQGMYVTLTCRKTNMFTLSGFSEDLNGVTMLQAILNTRSEGALVAHIVIYFLPTFERRGNRA